MNKRLIKDIIVESFGGIWGTKPEGSDLPTKILRSTNVTKDNKVTDLDNVAKRHIPEKLLSKYLLQEGDIIITKSSGSPDHIGKSILIDEILEECNYSFANFMQLIRVDKKEILPEYLFLYISNQTIRDKILKESTTTTGLRNLKINAIMDLEIPLPSILEQKQIVSKIKECFTLLDKSEEKLKQAQKKLNSVMDSVYYKEIPTPENLKGSTIIKLEELAQKITDGSHNPPMKQKNGKLMLSAINIENDFLNIEANVRYIKEEDFNKELNRSGVKMGDVLLTAVGTIGRTLVVKEFTDFVLQRSVTLIRPKDTDISQYLSYYLRTPYMQRYFLENAKGTAQKGIYLSTIRKLEVVIPERSKMQTIIEKIENVRTATTNSLKHIESLQKNLQIERQSILKKAFEGKLI